MRVSGFDTGLEHIIVHYLFGQNPSNKTRIMLKENDILLLEDFLNYPGYEKLTYQKNSVTIKLKDGRFKMINQAIRYSKYFV